MQKIKFLSLLILKVVFSTGLLLANDITTLPLNNPNLCTNSSINVSFAVSAGFNSGNQFIAQLSDEFGNFFSPTNIGTVTGTLGGSIPCTIPNVNVGTNYRVRVIGTNPASIGTDNGSNLTINLSTPVSLNPLPGICPNSGSIALSTGSPTGGNYSGSGIVANVLFSDLLSPGIYNYTYTFTNTSGCVSSATSTFEISPLPSVNLSPLGTICSNDLPFTISNGSPAGGTYSGNGVTGNTFDPALSGPGNHVITYTITDGATGCSNSASQSVTVLQAPAIGISAPNQTCINGGLISLSGIPSGGTFTGNGISGNSFDPSAAGLGSTTITYSFTASNGCASSTTFNINVNAQPTVSLNPLASVCSPGSPLNLTGGNPANGTFSGTGVINNIFYPNLTGTGTFPITYTFTDANGCSGSTTQSIDVNASPSITLNFPNFICLNGSPVTLNATPSGGIFSGAGVVGNTFNPSVSGIGTFSISYTFTDGNGCTSTGSQNITVTNLASASIIPLGPLCNNDNPAIVNAIPSGGVLSGIGIIGNTFDPSVSGIGTHTIYYAVSSGNGCTTIDSIQVTVNQSPSVSISIPTNYCTNDAPINLTGGNPSGGTYSGNGVINNLFNPNIAGAGNHQITYTFSDINGCTSSASSIVSVFAAPIVTLSSFNPVCLNSSPINLAGGLPSGGTYAGNGVSNNSFDPSLAGVGFFQITYSFTNANGCSSSAVNNIQVVELSLNAGNDQTITCGGSAQLNALANFTGIGNIQYSWSPSTGLSNPTVSNPVATPNSTTNYVVTATAGACSVQDQIQVSVNNPNFNLAFTQNQQVFNNPPFNVVFINNTPNPNNYTFTWIFGDGVTSINNSQLVSHTYVNNGDYDVTLIAVNNQTGCSDTLFYPSWISCSGSCTHLAQINQASPVIACAGGSGFLSCNTAPGYTYQWNFNGLPISGANDTIFQPTQSGFYSVTIFLNSCPRVSDAVFVDFLPAPPVPVITSVGNIAVCSGNQALLQSTTGYSSYSWRRVGTQGSLGNNPVLSTSTTGLYFMVVSDNNGCTSSSQLFPLNFSYLFPGELCVVDVNDDNENVIVWDKPITNTISAFKILRETQVTNIYDTLGTVNYADLSEFIDTDTTVNPLQQAYSYRLALVDTCGGTTLPGGRHKTMHLTINQGINPQGGLAWNLIWSSYEGAVFGTYYIYRTTDFLNPNWTLLGTQASGANIFNSFSDINPPVGYVGYRIVIELDDPCESTMRDRAQYGRTRSNTGSNGIIPEGIQNLSANPLQLNVYPNPNSGEFFLSVESKTNNVAFVEISNYLGQVLKTIQTNVINGESIIKIDANDLAKGIYNLRVIQGDNTNSAKIVIH
jgi:hypothetical protein